MPNNQKEIGFELVTPERVVFREQISQVTVPTKEGEITILPKHMPLIAILSPGAIEIVNADNERKVVSVSGGFVEVLLNKVVVLADTAEREDEIDLERAEEARVKAEEQMKASKKEMMSEKQYAEVISVVEKQLARIKVAKKYAPKTSRGLSEDK